MNARWQPENLMLSSVGEMMIMKYTHPTHAWERQTKGSTVEAVSVDLDPEIRFSTRETFISFNAVELL